MTANSYYSDCQTCLLLSGDQAYFLSAGLPADLYTSYAGGFIVDRVGFLLNLNSLTGQEFDDRHFGEPSQV